MRVEHQIVEIQGRTENNRKEQNERSSIIESKIDNLHGQVQNLQIQAERTEDKIASCETSILNIKEFLATGDAVSLLQTPGKRSSDIQIMSMQKQIKYLQRLAESRISDESAHQITVLLGGMSSFDSEASAKQCRKQIFGVDDDIARRDVYKERFYRIRILQIRIRIIAQYIHQELSRKHDS